MNNTHHSLPEEYQKQIWADSFWTRPQISDFDSRKKLFFDQILRNGPGRKDSKQAMVEVLRLAAGGNPDEEIIQKSITEFVEGRKDCADFVMQAVIRMLYQFGEGANRRFSPELLAHAKNAVLGFKYWPDEPGFDEMCTWTENHHILFSTAAYLAGQLFPAENFINSGRTGLEMMEVHRPRIEQWLEMRYKSGFSEWLSNVYYDEDWAALLNLIDLSLDQKLKIHAQLVLDISLLDVVLNSFQGVFGSTHGRSYQQQIKWAALEGTTDVTKLLFGTGSYSGYELFSAALFSISNNYKMPQVLYEIAHDKGSFINRQRMGHRTKDAEKWGLTYSDYESAMVYFSNADFLHPRNADLTIHTFDAFNWWEHKFHKNLRTFRKIFTLLSKLGLLSPFVNLLKKDISRNVRDEVNIYTYRTPDYMLSSAQDYRPSYGGNQQHIWQATLGPNAICFTTYPPNDRHDGSSPNYWTGSGSLPRVAQIENVVIAVYNVNPFTGLTVPNKLSMTHAWLPKDQFDEIIEKDGWIFARKNEGYLALRSMKPYRWQDEPGEDQYREIKARGKKNIWICELGRKHINGDFICFIEDICAAHIQFRGLSVRYQSPSQGYLEFGWKKSFSIKGQVIELERYPRYDNPFVQAKFGANEMYIRDNGQEIYLNWETGERRGK